MPRWVLCGEADGGRVGRERRETWLFRWWRGALTDRRRVGAPPQSEGRERRETGLFRWWRGALTERRGLGAPPQCGELAGNVSTPSTRWRAFQEETIGLLVNIYFKTYIYLFLLKKKKQNSWRKSTVTQSSVLAWEIPWSETPGGLQSRGHKEPDTAEQLSMHAVL